MTQPFRAPNEYAFAAFLDALAVPWKYEALEGDISRAIRYQPDFWLPDSLAWLEVKPTGHAPTPGEIRVAWQLVEATGRPVYICAGWPEPRLLTLAVTVFSKQPGTQVAMGKLALRWLALLVNRPLPDVLAAGRVVMSRRLEFVRTWQGGRE